MKMKSQKIASFANKIILVIKNETEDLHIGNVDVIKRSRFLPKILDNILFNYGHKRQFFNVDRVFATTKYQKYFLRTFLED